MKYPLLFLVVTQNILLKNYSEHVVCYNYDLVFEKNLHKIDFYQKFSKLENCLLFEGTKIVSNNSFRTVCSSKEKGGLGIRNLFLVNMAL